MIVVADIFNASVWNFEWASIWTFEVWTASIVTDNCCFFFLAIFNFSPLDNWMLHNNSAPVKRFCNIFVPLVWLYRATGVAWSLWYSFRHRFGWIPTISCPQAEWNDTMSGGPLGSQSCLSLSSLLAGQLQFSVLIFHTINSLYSCLLLVLQHNPLYLFNINIAVLHVMLS